LAIVFSAACTGPKDGMHKIVVCTTTDIHGAYFDSTYVGDQANRTSMANVSTYVKNMRADGINPVLIDVGDNLQGDNAAYYFNFVKTDVKHLVPRIYEYIGYDALVVGNHDIETGHEVYDRIKKEIKIPYLAANAAFDKDEDGVADVDEDNDDATVYDPYFQPYCLVERDGIKIAIIGMTNGNIKNWLSSTQWHGIDFQIISDMAQKAVDDARAKYNPHLVILAIHSGTGSEESDRENEAHYLAGHVKGIDILLGGHDHTAIAEVVSNPGGDVVLLNAGTRAGIIGQVDYLLEMKDGKIISRTYETRLIPTQDIPVDEDYMAFFQKDFDEVKEFANKPIGTLTDDIYMSECVKGPSSYISLVHAVQLDATGADISISAPLVDRGVVRKGTLTFNDLTALYRYENKLYLVEMTGRQIKDFLEFSYNDWISGKGHLFNYDSAEGIIYEVSKSAPKGAKVNIISMSDGTPFDMDKTYKVAMNSYRASGGGYHLRDGAGINPDDLVILEKFKDIRSMIGDYISKVGEVTPFVSDNWKFVE
jgi:5''-nucleotidase/2'',3''-cyclic phosphodiesterase and related esterases